MSFLHDNPYTGSYYDQKDFFEPPPQLSVMSQAYAFQQIQNPSPYHPTTLHLSDSYQRPVPVQAPVFYYASAAGPSLTTTSLLNLDPTNNHHTNTLLSHTTIVSQDELRAESEDISPPRKRGSGGTGSKRGRPTKNPVWTFFRRLDEKSVQCNMCGRLVKSACATNMTKHIERHHQELAEVPTTTVKFENGMAYPWNGYPNMQPLKLMTGFEGYTGSQDTSLPWNPDRRGAKRNRRTKHPVWELFRRTVDGQAQCQLCNVLVRSPCSSNFMGHLNRHHTEHYSEIYKRWLDGRGEAEQASPEGFKSMQ